MPGSLSRPPKKEHEFRRVAIVFAGGPAPAANAVISTCAASFLRDKTEVLGILHGYSGLTQFGPDHPLQAGRDYVQIDSRLLRRTRNSQGILIGTARTNPGKDIAHPSHLDDPERVAPLKRVYEGLCSLEVDALISIGGDDTLKTANKLKVYQDRLPDGSRRIPVVHVPKTIDNDYHGIDFTFGYFTAVNFLAQEIRNLLYDAEAGRSYYLVETMGRSAGWLAYGAAIAGEASLVISVEDVEGDYLESGAATNDRPEGTQHPLPKMNMEKLVDRIVDQMIAREEEKKEFGVIVLAEGLAECLPEALLRDIPRDDHGHVSIAHVNLGKLFAGRVEEGYKKRTGRRRRVTGLQLGYVARCAEPHAFDVMLGSQLGVGAYRALTDHKRNGVMVSVVGQLELDYVPFEKLVDPQTLVTRVRYIDRQSDFHTLARFLETYVKR
jgi:6-phosphofructokinase